MVLFLLSIYMGERRREIAVPDNIPGEHGELVFVPTNEVKQKIDDMFANEGAKLDEQTKARLMRQFKRAVARDMHMFGKGSRNKFAIDLEPIEVKEKKSALLSARISVLGEKIRNTSLHQEQGRLNPDLATKPEMVHIFASLTENLKPQEKIVIVAADLDNFKIINDKMGHQAGDAVIKSFGGSLAQSLQEAARPDDVVAHFSGDEFGLLLILPSNVDEVQILKRIIGNASLGTKRPMGEGDTKEEIQGVSSGYSLVTREDIDDITKKNQSVEDFFVTKLNEADQNSILSKAIAYAYENRQEHVHSGDRVIGVNSRAEFSTAELELARSIHGTMRGFQESRPDLPREMLFEYASIVNKLLKVVKVEDREKLLKDLQRVLDEIQARG